MKRQRYSESKKAWLLQEKRNGFWYTLKERKGTNNCSRQIGRFIGVPVTTKPQFRG